MIVWGGGFSLILTGYLLVAISWCQGKVSSRKAVFFRGLQQLPYAYWTQVSKDKWQGINLQFQLYGFSLTLDLPAERNVVHQALCLPGETLSLLWTGIWGVYIILWEYYGFAITASLVRAERKTERKLYLSSKTNSTIPRVTSASTSSFSQNSA